jgi:hypothetical protein
MVDDAMKPFFERGSDKMDQQPHWEVHQAKVGLGVFPDVFSDGTIPC